MAQPHYAIEYYGSITATKGKVISTSTIKDLYPDATVMKMKTKNVSVGIAGTPMFLTSFDDESFIPTTNTTYIFDNDCVIAIGKYVSIS